MQRGHAGSQAGDAAPARLRRLRWRLRGAWQWPAFAVGLVADSLLMHLLPVSGTGTDLIGALLLAGFANLAAVGVLAPLVGRGVRRARPDLPRVVASDYAGTALVLALAAVLLVLGLAHRPAVLSHERAVRAQSEALRRFVLTQGSDAYRRHLDSADSLQLGEDLFRSCVPGADAAHSLCLIIDTTQSPPGIRQDPNPIPNSRYLGSHGLGSEPG